LSEPIHPRELSFEDGVFLVKLARTAIEKRVLEGVVVEPPMNTPKHLYRPGMTFTTIELVTSTGAHTLRGCIGFLQPVYSLVESTIQSAIEAALNDPRFPPLTPEELDSIVVEVSVLSIPEVIVVENRWELPRRIIIGRDGLVAEKGFYKGTLLPVVPIEYCWDEETFLAETCLKAGLNPDCWLERKTRIYRYEGRAFKEVEPRGEVVELDLRRIYEEKCLAHHTE